MRPRKPESLNFLCPLAKGIVECVLAKQFQFHHLISFPPSPSLSPSPSLFLLSFFLPHISALHTYLLKRCCVPVSLLESRDTEMNKLRKTAAYILVGETDNKQDSK